MNDAFGAAEPSVYKSGLLHLLPPPHRPRAAEAVAAIDFNLRHWLADPPGVKPGADMPNLHLTQQQIDALIAYLQSRK